MQVIHHRLHSTLGYRSPTETETLAAATERADTAPLWDLVEARRGDIKAIVARHHGRSVAIFGSVVRGEERPESDIDFLVELAPDARPIDAVRVRLIEIGEAAKGIHPDRSPQHDHPATGWRTSC